MNKPNKLDLRMRWVQTQALEMDCPALKERSSIFAGRMGEFTTTREVFIPGNIIRDLQKVMRNPELRESIMGAIMQLAGNIAVTVAGSGAGDIINGAVGVAAKAAQGAEGGRYVREPPTAQDAPESPSVIGPEDLGIITPKKKAKAK